MQIKNIPYDKLKKTLQSKCFCLLYDNFMGELGPQCRCNEHRSSLYDTHYAQTFQNDNIGYFDRMIPSHTILTSRKCGVPD